MTIPLPRWLRLALWLTHRVLGRRVCGIEVIGWMAVALAGFAASRLSPIFAWPWPAQLLVAAVSGASLGVGVGLAFDYWRDFLFRMAFGWAWRHGQVREVALIDGDGQEHLIWDREYGLRKWARDWPRR